jgi:hypothetical protein
VCCLRLPCVDRRGIAPVFETVRGKRRTKTSIPRIEIFGKLFFFVNDFAGLALEKV